MLSKYTDNGSSATLSWTQVGGGSGTDLGYDIALSGQRVYAAGAIIPPATFGNNTITTPASFTTTVLASLVDTSPTPLPVQLVTFTATPQGPANVALAWTTASETNSARFEVERSADGTAFGRIEEIAAAGTSSATHTYGLLDAALPAGASVLYYRLRQVELDGTFSRPCGWWPCVASWRCFQTQLTEWLGLPGPRRANQCRCSTP